jgi:guanosine-3',5'-bis(diphosphate) 3'-pyrophosphohydrolase
LEPPVTQAPETDVETTAPAPSLVKIRRPAAPPAVPASVALDVADEPARPARPSTPRSPAPSRRVRNRLARLGSARGSGTPPVLEPLLRTMRQHQPKLDPRLVQRAYELAADAHEGQVRRSGDPYITHPLAVAAILAELGMDEPTVIAALLHDTVEDTPVELAAVREEFGELVALVVDGVTKLDRVKVGGDSSLDSAEERDADKRAAEAETIRKMVVAMAKDPRVLVVKLADRLHNMRTLRYLPAAKQERKARETLEIYAPLAHRLGMNTLKWELEDLSFATLYPKRYDEIVRLVADRAPSRDTYLQEVVAAVEASLAESRIKATVTGRPKHYYSIYQKMIVRGRDFADIYDLVGIRILVESERDCYAVLGSLHGVWSPVPGRFKDYIAMPKFNMYRSLHTTVIGPGGKPVELQIRTHAMHRVADYGIAAHWKYKEGSKAGKVGTAVDTGAEMAWLKQILEWQRETSDPGEFLDALRFDLHTGEVFVFTPKGDVQALPTGSCPIDFAYAVHTEVGHRCIGARVNGRLVPLESVLNNGDVVEIFTSKASTAGPSRDWLAFAASSRAKTKIRQWFAKERREDSIEDGKEAIQRAMRKQGLPLQRLMTGETLLTLAKDMRHADVSSLFASVGEGQLSAQAVVGRLLQSLGGSEGMAEDLAETAVPTRARSRSTGNDTGVVVGGLDAGDVWVKLSRCCTPVPGDAITGFVTRGNGVSVHRSDCVNVAALAAGQQPAADLGPDVGAEVGVGGTRMIDVSWAASSESVFLVAMQVEALDRTRLLSDVTRVLSDHHVNILSATVTTTRDRVAVSRFSFEMGSTAHLGHLLASIRGVDGVYDCYRVVSTAKS